MCVCVCVCERERERETQRERETETRREGERDRDRDTQRETETRRERERERRRERERALASSAGQSADGECALSAENSRQALAVIDGARAVTAVSCRTCPNRKRHRPGQAEGLALKTRGRGQ